MMFNKSNQVFAVQAAEAQAIQELEAKGGSDWEAYQNGDYATQQKILNRLEAYRTASDLAHLGELVAIAVEH
jgi:hypothetical protein